MSIEEVSTVINTLKLQNKKANDPIKQGNSPKTIGAQVLQKKMRFLSRVVEDVVFLSDSSLKSRSIGL